MSVFAEPGLVEPEVDWPALYRQLRAIAARLVGRDRRQETLQATALVHEAYLRLGDTLDPSRPGKRARMLAIAARSMREVLVDHARRRGAHKRGRGWRPVPLDGVQADDTDLCTVLAVHEALERLGSVDAQLVDLVELRFFGGLTHAEVAEAMGVAEVTVKRMWKLARGWLRQQMAA